MDSNFNVELDNYFNNLGLRKIPNTYKEKLIILRNIANNCESDIVILDDKCSKLLLDDNDRSNYVNQIRCLESEYFEARYFIRGVKEEIFAEKRNNFKSRVKSIFKK